jgi:hypothetical protein
MAIVIVTMVVAACSSTTPPTTTNSEIAAIRAYADPATQTTLEGLSEDNLAKYTQYADAQFKAAVTQDLLDKTSAQIDSQLGSFVSITFSSTEKQGEYTIVHYKSKYSKGDVGIRMIFDQDHLVAGQWFE